MGFSGQVSTVKCFENNPLVRKALEEKGNGRVLVVDGGGSQRCALLGDNIAEMAYKNGWDVRVYLSTKHPVRSCTIACRLQYRRLHRKFTSHECTYYMFRYMYIHNLLSHKLNTGYYNQWLYQRQ